MRRDGVLETIIRLARDYRIENGRAPEVVWLSAGDEWDLAAELMDARGWPAASLTDPAGVVVGAALLGMAVREGRVTKVGMAGDEAAGKGDARL